MHDERRPPTTTPPPPSLNPSGQPMPVGDLPGWHQVFADDFTYTVPVGSFPQIGNPGPDPAVAAKWTSYPGGWPDTTHHGQYMPSRVISVAGGVLNLYLHTEGGIHMVAAPEPIIPGAVGSEGGLLYGKYVARFRADPVPGYKTAWLLWPDSELWPQDGEIDFPEGSLNATMSAFMHWMGGTAASNQDAYPSSVPYGAWHTVEIDWLPTGCSFILDGAILGTSTLKIPSTPMHWVLQTETATDGTVPTAAAAGNVQVDWVVVYVPAA